VVIIISHHFPKNDLVAWLDRRKVLVLSLAALAARPLSVSRTVPVAARRIKRSGGSG
jgi:hypothetical protein